MAGLDPAIHRASVRERWNLLGFELANTLARAWFGEHARARFARNSRIQFFEEQNEQFRFAAPLSIFRRFEWELCAFSLERALARFFVANALSRASLQSPRLL
jgi:hypothetical protein